MKKLSVFISISMIFLFFFGCDQSAKDDEVLSKVPVAVEPVHKGDVQQTLSFNGDITAKHEVKVFSKIPDRIVQFYVEEGDPVSKGQMIAQIQATAIEQAVLQAFTTARPLNDFVSPSTSMTISGPPNGSGGAMRGRRTASFMADGSRSGVGRGV